MNPHEAKNNSEPVNNCLRGGGDMGTLMRAFDWTRTGLGPVSGWPQSLRTVVSICLNSRFPIVVWWGPDLIMLYNDAYSPVLGRTKHPGSLGRPARHAWSEIWPVVGPMLEGVLATGEATWSEDLLLIFDRNLPQEEVYFTFSYSPIMDDAGGIGGVFCACTETTERVIGERRMRTLRDLAARGPEAKTAVQACAIEGEILLANTADVPFSLIYLLDEDGKSATRTAGNGAELGPAAAPAVITLTDETQVWPLAEVAHNGAAQLVLNLGAKFPALPRAGPWPEPADSALVLPITAPGQRQLAGFLIAGINPRRVLDDQYRAFYELLAGHVATAVGNAQAYEHERKRAESLAELDRAKTAFFSNVSHEFRTPLTLLIGPLEDALADQAALPVQHQERLALAHRNTLRLLKLVNSLLDFSRIEAGRAQASYTAVDLARLTEDLASSFRSAIERAGMQLIVDCPPLPQPVYVDRDMWEKMVLNLLSNAFKFTFEGRISVSLRASGPAVELRVEDTGAGIPEDQLLHIFERFHRVEGARGRTYEGTGIGLALVQELAKLHGGTVQAESVYGKGSTFIVRVPFGNLHLPHEHVKRQPAAATTLKAAAFVEEALRWLPESNRAGISEEVPACDDMDDLPAPESVSAGTAESGGRILLADDNADMRNYVKRLLGGRYEIDAVADGMQALIRAREDPPDLILTDVMMPQLDGFGLLKELRSDPKTRNVPIILLSARAGEESKVEGMEAGADDYLIKPFSARELLARVSAHLGMVRLRNQLAQALTRRVSELETLLKTLQAGITIAEDPDCRNIRVNPAMAEMAGMPAGDKILLETGLAATLPPYKLLAYGKEIPAHQLPLQVAAREGREIRDVEMDLLRSDGLVIKLFGSASPLFDEHGKTRGAVSVFIDITAQKMAAEALEESNRALRNSNDELRQFAYAASHDLQEPLRMITSYTQLLARHIQISDETSGTYMGFIHSGVKRMQNLLRDLLTYAQVIHVDAPPASLVDMNGVVSQVILVCGVAISESQAAVIAEPLPTVYGEQTRLVQVLQNLVSNALKYRQKDVPPSIRISAAQNENEWVFSVKDNGMGIAPEYTERIFGLFKRLHGQEYPGTGLGLAICKRIIDQHHGRIWVESVPGEGSTFFFTIPIA